MSSSEGVRQKRKSYTAEKQGEEIEAKKPEEYNECWECVVIASSMESELDSASRLERWEAKPSRPNVGTARSLNLELAHDQQEREHNVKELHLSATDDADPVFSVKQEVDPELETYPHIGSVTAARYSEHSDVTTTFSSRNILPGFSSFDSLDAVPINTKAALTTHWTRVLQVYPQHSPEYNRAIMFFNASRRLLGPPPETSEDEDEIYCNNMYSAFGATSPQYMHAVLIKRNNIARRQAFRDAGYDPPPTSRLVVNSSAMQYHETFTNGQGPHPTGVVQDGAVLVQDVPVGYSDVEIFGRGTPMPRYPTAPGNPFSGSSGDAFSYAYLGGLGMPEYRPHGLNNQESLSLASENVDQNLIIDAEVTPKSQERAPEPSGVELSPVSSRQKHRFVNESQEHLNLFLACRRHFSRYFSITDEEAKGLVTKYCGTEPVASQEMASKCLDRWRINWQTKLIRDLKRHLIQLSKTNPEIESITWEDAQEFFAALFSDVKVMRDNVFSSLTAVVDITALVKDDGLAGELYRSWYQHICYFMIKDLGKFEEGKWCTSTVFSRQLYDDFRGIARHDKFQDLDIDGIPMLQEGSSPPQRIRKKRNTKDDNVDKNSTKRQKRVVTV
ncbi:hypothetical protein K440DRAFT_643299 [Wilcoxina mikolae CBS 423.85]|nr:hypothetical protein K440DRAFT_643299 [Wilcoxina mikolae CBS 423.85]